MNTYYFRSHDNRIYKVDNLTKFCKERGLTSNSMRRLDRGLIKSHKGWISSNEDQWIGYSISIDVMKNIDGYKQLGDAFNLWLKSKSKSIGVSEMSLLSDMTKKYKRLMRNETKIIDKPML